MKVIVIGGGIGGLTTALALHAFGIEAELFEKSTEIGDVGAGIQISPNAMKVFEELNVGEALVRRGFRPEGIEIRMGESGMRLIRSPLGDVAQRRYGSPYLHIHRADLIEVLAEAAAARLPQKVHLNASLTSYEQNREGITARFAGGEEISADVLIGADGIHSVVRENMLGSGAPQFTGNVAWRAVVPVERLGVHKPDPVVCAWMGRGKHAVTYLLRQGELANLIAVVERDDWTKEDWREQGSREDALNDFRTWHPIVTQLIKKSDVLYKWALFDRPPLKTWSKGCVAILGDAAHPMLPFMAQGAAMAIEDAWALAACLAKASDVQTALRQYQSLRYNRASKIQAGSRANAQTFHQRSTFGRLKNYGPIWLAGKLAPSIGLKRQDWIYRYDVTSQAK